MAGERRKEGTSCERVDKGHRDFRKWILVFCIFTDCANQHYCVGYPPLLYVWLHHICLLCHDGSTARNDELHEQVHG